MLRRDMKKREIPLLVFNMRSMGAGQKKRQKKATNAKCDSDASPAGASPIEQNSVNNK